MGGMNRAMRRKEMREQMREWVRMGQAEKVQRLTKNGYGEKDLNESYQEGFSAGFKVGTDKTLKTVYAGAVLEMLDAGNSKEEALSFLKNLDERLIRSISEEEDIEEVFDKTGVKLMLKEDFDRIQQVRGDME